MRTSGASVNDTGLVVLTLVCAAIVLTILLGGPSDVLYGLESLLRSGVDAFVELIQSRG
jgi:hypothetical protein